MLTIEDVRAQEKGITLIAGARGLGRQVTRTHMVENLEIAEKFIAEGEMIFTTGAGLDGAEELYDLMTAAHRNKASGVVVNIGPYIGGISDRVREFAEDRELPLFSCPWEVRMAEIMHRVGCMADSAAHSGSPAEVLRRALLGSDEHAALEGLGFTERARCRVAVSDAAIHAEGAYGISIGGSAVTVFAGADREAVRAACGATSASVSGEFPGTELSAAYAQAVMLSRLFAGRSGARFFEDSGAYRLLLGIKDRAMLEGYRDSAIGALLRYDAKKKSDLLEVLEKYIACGSGLKEAAELLGVHKNTVMNKVHRCGEILGADIADPMARLDLGLAIMAHRLLEAERG